MFGAGLMTEEFLGSDDPWCQMNILQIREWQIQRRGVKQNNFPFKQDLLRIVNAPFWQVNCVAS